MQHLPSVSPCWHDGTLEHGQAWVMNVALETVGSTMADLVPCLSPGTTVCSSCEAVELIIPWRCRGEAGAGSVGPRGGAHLHMQGMDA